MSTLTAFDIASLVKAEISLLTSAQPSEGYHLSADGQEEWIWIIAEADFDNEYGAVLQVISEDSPRPYIMVWWSGPGDLGLEVEWIHNTEGDVKWTDAIATWANWIADVAGVKS